MNTPTENELGKLKHFPWECLHVLKKEDSNMKDGRNQ